MNRISLKHKKILISILITFFLSPGISFAEDPQNKSQAVEMFKAGVAYFDKGIEASNNYSFDAAKEYVRLSLSIFLSSRALDPHNNYAKGFIYLAKGFMYHLSGTQMRMAIQSDSNPYTVLVQLRRAYYPLKHAEYYYGHSLEYIEDPNTRTYIDGMMERNDKEIKLVKKFLPQVDYKASRFMSAIENEAESIVNFDKINDLITGKNYQAVNDILKKNKKLAKKLKRLKSDNASGFINLTNAYENLVPVMEALDEKDDQLKANISFLSGKLNLCIDDTHVAEKGFRDAALSELCGNLRDNAMKIKASLRERTGVAI